MAEERSLTEKLRDAWPGLRMPTLGKTVDIPVYIIHNSADAEDYFFIFDFEQFVERSRSGMFVRPRLKVWAGRNDFARRRFARQFRESFAVEFEAARAALAAGKTRDMGWFGQALGFGLGAASQTVPGFVALQLLRVATSAGGAIWSLLPNRPRLRPRKSDQEKLEDSISETQSKVDAALAAMQVTLHPALHRHAWRGATSGPRAGMDSDVWPLPDFVARHLETGRSTSWW